jgi:hypothetical protein
VIVSREIYASAALAGAVILTSLVGVDAPREFAVRVSLAIGLLIRAAALHYGWSLPRYQEHSGLLEDGQAPSGDRPQSQPFSGNTPIFFYRGLPPT